MEWSEFLDGVVFGAGGSVAGRGVDCWLSASMYDVVFDDELVGYVRRCDVDGGWAAFDVGGREVACEFGRADAASFLVLDGMVGVPCA